MQDKFQVNTAETPVFNKPLLTENAFEPEKPLVTLDTSETSEVKHKTGERVTGVVVKASGELHLAVEGKTYMLHFTTLEALSLKVDDQISGQLFVYENPESVKRFGYVQLGTVRKLS